MKSLLRLVCLLVFAGCVTVPPPATQSGRVELTVPGVTSTGCVKSQIISRLAGHGYSLRSETDHQIVMGKPADNIAASVLFGSRWDSTPESRAIITVLQSGGNVRVIVEDVIITNPGTGMERRQAIHQTQKNQNDFQSWIPLLQDACLHPGL